MGRSGVWFSGTAYGSSARRAAFSDAVCGTKSAFLPASSLFRGRDRVLSAAFGGVRRVLFISGKNKTSGFRSVGGCRCRLFVVCMVSVHSERGRRFGRIRLSDLVFPAGSHRPVRFFFGKENRTVKRRFANIRCFVVLSDCGRLIRADVSSAERFFRCGIDFLFADCQSGRCFAVRFVCSAERNRGGNAVLHRLRLADASHGRQSVCRNVAKRNVFRDSGGTDRRKPCGANQSGKRRLPSGLVHRRGTKFVGARHRNACLYPGSNEKFTNL